MAWTERQQSMLQAMGLRVWSPPAGTDAQAGDVAAEPDAVEPPQARSVSAVPVSVPVSARVSAPGRAGQTADRAPAVGRVVAPAPAAIPAEAAAAPSTLRAPATGVASPVAALDWPALREAVAGCRACGLCESRRQTVFGVGGARAHWMVIGEAPGEQEDREGEPFVGASGQLLDRMLAALGVSRDAEDSEPARQVYIANTLKCRPPGNRNPAADEMARCEPFLVRQIELLQPRIILAMGRFAVQALLRTTDPIGKLRGRVHSYQGVPLIVTYHPAYLLRNLPDKAKAWEDLCLAAATAERAGG
jgi:DNA polymerase